MSPEDVLRKDYWIWLNPRSFMLCQSLTNLLQNRVKGSRKPGNDLFCKPHLLGPSKHVSELKSLRFFKIVLESFLELVLSYNWDKSLIPSFAQTTISSDNEKLEDLFADDKLFPDNEWTAKYKEERKEKEKLRF